MIDPVHSSCVRVKLTDWSLFKRVGHFKYNTTTLFVKSMPKVVPEYKEEARSRILDAASRVFAEKGYHEATMEDVAKQLGVSKGALYLYFSSKEHLFEAMVKTAPQAFKEILYSSFGDEADPVQSATRFFDAMIKRFGSNPRLSLEILSEASRNPALRRVLRQNQEEYAKGLASFL